MLKLAFSQVKQFNFSWAPAPGAEHYQLWESATGDQNYVQIPDGKNILDESISLTMPLHLRFDASYELRACNANGCTPSAKVHVIDTLAALTGAVGYFKASNTGTLDGVGDSFGYCVAISADGTTLAVGAPYEDGAGKGFNPPDDNAAPKAGAVYVFARVAENVWQQQAYIKATQTETLDQFGLALALSADGDTLAVGAHLEDAAANSIKESGAVYVYVRTGGDWAPKGYIKASNAGVGDAFGHNVALSGDGNTLAVGAYYEDSSDTGINGQKNDNLFVDSGAVYVFVWANPVWVQQAYIKASDAAKLDRFGHTVALSGDGDTLAVGAPYKDAEVGAAYVFVRAGGGWSEQVKLKASNPGAGDRFGLSSAMSADGNTLAFGAHLEDSASKGVDDPDDGDDMTTTDSGAVYVYVRANDVWSAPTYIKASNTEANDYFGLNLALSADGEVLAITARDEDGGATGVGGKQEPNVITDSGAVYVFEWNNAVWAQRSYVKATNAGVGDRFGLGVALSSDGSTLVVGAYLEDSSAKGINKEQGNNGAKDAGAVYAY